MTLIVSPHAKNFRNYGKIIEYPNKSAKGSKRNLWRIVHSEPTQAGWRIAYLILRDKTMGRMECHPTSDETFEPVKGKAIIFVSNLKNYENIKCFYLDKPIIIKKGIWHGLITITPETEIKIFENNNVTCEYWQFGSRIRKPEDLPLKSKS